MPHIQMIPFSCGWGGTLRECADGPRTLQHFQLSEHLESIGVEAAWSDDYYSPMEEGADNDLSPAKALPLVVDYNRVLCEQVQSAIASGAIPVALGGDHSMAVGTWSGVTSALKAQSEFGLIWFDAHMDSHTPRTSPSGAYHGMPLAVLLGEGEKELCQIGGRGRKISPEHLCLVGARSYEPEETKRLQELGVRVITMEEVRDIGMEAAMQEALAIASKAPKGFGLSLDLDGFDPEVAPGVGCPESNGIGRVEGLKSLIGLAHHPKFKALEIAEFNPNLDKNEQTARLVVEVLSVMWAGV